MAVLGPTRNPECERRRDAGWRGGFRPRSQSVRCRRSDRPGRVWRPAATN